MNNDNLKEWKEVGLSSRKKKTAKIEKQFFIKWFDNLILIAFIFTAYTTYLKLLQFILIYL